VLTASSYFNPSSYFRRIITKVSPESRGSSSAVTAPHLVDGDRFYGIEHSTGRVTLAWHVHVMPVSRGAVLQNAKHHVLPIPEFPGRVMGRSKDLSR